MSTPARVCTHKHVVCKYCTIHSTCSPCTTDAAGDAPRASAASAKASKRSGAATAAGGEQLQAVQVFSRLQQPYMHPPAACTPAAPACCCCMGSSRG